MYESVAGWLLLGRDEFERRRAAEAEWSAQIDQKMAELLAHYRIEELIKGLPPERSNPWYWLCLFVAEDYIEGFKLVSERGLGGKPPDWTPARLRDLAADAAELQRRNPRISDRGACRLLASKGRWSEYKSETLRERLRHARQSNLGGNPSPSSQPAD